MANDRRGLKLHLGDMVKLIPGMRVGRRSSGIVINIDGEDITLDVRCVIVHRYGSEMWITGSIWHDYSKLRTFV